METASSQVDTVITAGWVIPVETRGEVLENHAVCVYQGRITAILPIDDARKRFPEGERADSESPAVEWIDLPHHALTPGFVNAHGHAAMTLLRGLADDLPLMSWLNDHIWPAEQRWVSPDFIRDGVELAILEMLSGGTTTFSDMYFFPDATARAAQKFGIRAAIGMAVIEFPTAWASDAQEYIRKGLAVRDEFKSDDLLSFFFAPHAPYTVNDNTLREIQRIADEIDLSVQMHVHETASEVADATREHGERPLARLDRIGLLSPNFMAVHMTTLDENEISRVAETGANVIHCPESNLKLASGLCPVAQLLEAGINVALGTDGAASNNDLDMLGEMRTAAMLAKAVTDAPTAVPAEVALEMATLNGARALGLAEETGSIKVGKSADLIAIDLSAAATTPVYNPVSQIVYAACRDQVTHSWIAGRPRMLDRQLQGVDSPDIMRRAAGWRERIAEQDSK